MDSEITGNLPAGTQKARYFFDIPHSHLLLMTSSEQIIEEAFSPLSFVSLEYIWGVVYLQQWRYKNHDSIWMETLIVIYSGIDFKMISFFLLLYVHTITGVVQPLSVSYKRNHRGGGMRLFQINS